MKVGVVSDSHGNLKSLKKALDKMGDVGCIFHLGDYIEDGLYIRTLVDTPVHLIRGNMDEYSREGSTELFTTIGGFDFFACHGHTYGVKRDLNNLFHAGLEKNAQVILFGHTHKSFIHTEESILIMNPGSVGSPRIEERESYGIIRIEKDKIHGEIFTI